MAKFEAGMENMVDMFIFETTSLLEQLDQILMKTENESSFGSEDINEIFRTMHTIKGSSSMMGLENMSHLAHAVEDMFFIIREDNPEITDKKTLFDLVFTASDLLKTEIELLQEDEYTPTDFSGHMSKIEAYAKALKEGEGAAPAAAAQTAAPSQAAAAAVPEGKTIKVISNSGECMTTVKIFFEDDCKMENLRALLVINNIKSECSALTYEPSDIEDNGESAKTIIDNGFVIHFRPAADVTQDTVIDIIGNSLNVKSYEVTDAADSGTKEVPLASLSEAKVTFVEDCKMENLRALMVVNNIRDSVELLAFSPEDIENDPSTAQAIIENGFTIYFKAAEDQAIIDMIKATPNVKSAELVRRGGEAPAAEEKAPAKTEAAAAAPAKTDAAPAPKAAEQKDAKKTPPAVTGGAKQSLISVNLNKLDQLLDIVGEIVITEAMVTSSPDLKVKGLKLDNFQKAARQLRKLNSELQETVMSIRMVPLSGAFNKMTRIVRDMKVKLNKDVDLVFEGEETEVDKSIIDNLNDPLMHMVRNSMDHGIEDTAEERIAKGKPAKGKITLSAYNSSGEVIICVIDDGQGINPEKVLDKAEKNGMLTKPRSEYTDKEIFNMIMLPGFSTNEEVTEYSGRGVGMDVVKKNIEKTGGSVSVDSKWGEGTQFTIKIPLSLSIVDGMEISVGQSIFTIPIGVIKESFKIKPNQLLRDTNGSEMVMIRGECYPLIRLYDVFDLEPSSTDINDGIIILVEVESEGKSACLLADELIGEQQVVVKPFSPMLNNFNVKENGMAGCSILGDGSITIILDIGNIISDF
ncbi:MAG: chemotaxis protein CheA [Oscillospiraceae bacterium]|nr:chemotaxis protein CheA [Oscillospiraceae bacterium]MDY2846733.1 chemotaxis protein CheA [Oscillospiraceae bacterium]